MPRPVASSWALSQPYRYEHAPDTEPAYHPNLVHRMADNLPLVVTG